MTLDTDAWLWLKLLCLTLIAALAFEHSQVDVIISQLFYTHGEWLLQKGVQPYAFIFYNLPKALLIVLGIYLLAIFIIKSNQNLSTRFIAKSASLNRLVTPLSLREIAYLLIIIIIVPSSIALLKSVTHVTCPNHLMIFNGDLPYLNLWQNMLAQTPAKCFPAAHASAGFSLYGLVFLPTLHHYRHRLFEVVTLLGWTMGLYKMALGDHFFSHTLVSMLLSLTLACGLATLFFNKVTVSKIGLLTE